MSEQIRIKESKYVKHKKEGQLNKEAFLVSKELRYFLEQIKNGDFADIIGKIRYIKKCEETGKLNPAEVASSKEKRNRLKGKLPVIYPSHHCSYEGPELLYLPTGLYGGDIDLQDNPNVDFNLLKNELLAIMELKYLFISPSGGIKFAIKTDFDYKHYGEDVKSLSTRFKQGYEVILKHIKKHLSQEVVFDRGMSSFHFSCFASYDPNLYFNDACSSLKVQRYTHYKPVGIANDVDKTLPNYPVKDSETNETKMVYWLLSYVDRNLEY